MYVTRSLFLNNAWTKTVNHMEITRHGRRKSTLADRNGKWKATWGEYWARDESSPKRRNVSGELFVVNFSGVIDFVTRLIYDSASPQSDLLAYKYPVVGRGPSKSDRSCTRAANATANARDPVGITRRGDGLAKDRRAPSASAHLAAGSNRPCTKLYNLEGTRDRVLSRLVSAVVHEGVRGERSEINCWRSRTIHCSKVVAIDPSENAFAILGRPENNPSVHVYHEVSAIVGLARRFPRG